MQLNSRVKFKMEIVKDLKNDLFKRREISFKLEADKNPNFEEIKKKIAEQFSKPEENIDVYNIKGSFGKNLFIIDAHVYDSKKDLGEIKQLQKTQKKRGEEAKAEKAAAEEKAKADKEKADTASVEEKEDKEEKSEEKPTEAHLEDRPEEEAKSRKEKQEAAEEAKA